MDPRFEHTSTIKSRALAYIVVERTLIPVKEIEVKTSLPGKAGPDYWTMYFDS